MEQILLSKIQPDFIHYEDILNYGEDLSIYDFGSLNVSIINDRFDYINTIYRLDTESWGIIVFPIEQNLIEIINDVDSTKEFTTAPFNIMNQIEHKINLMWGDDIIKRIENRYIECDKNNQFGKVPNELLRRYVSENKEFKFRR